MAPRIDQGEVIDGFRLEAILHQGNLGTLWRVSRPGIDIPIVMKLPLLHAGSDPLASPDRSLGCQAGMFRVGENIDLFAYPDPHHHVSYWIGTANDTNQSMFNSMQMPDADTVVYVVYQ